MTKPYVTALSCYTSKSLWHSQVGSFQLLKQKNILLSFKINSYRKLHLLFPHSHGSGTTSSLGWSPASARALCLPRLVWKISSQAVIYPSSWCLCSVTEGMC